MSTPRVLQTAQEYWASTKAHRVSFLDWIASIFQWLVRNFKLILFNLIVLPILGLVYWSVNSVGLRLSTSALGVKLHRLPLPGFSVLRHYHGWRDIDLANVFAILQLGLVWVAAVLVMHVMVYGGFRLRNINEEFVRKFVLTVDAWAPAAQDIGLGRHCLEALLREPGWTVRILTKNAAAAEDFDLIRKYKDRVLVGISLTGTSDKEDVISAIEPNASPISERQAALRKACRMGLRTYGMLCPLLPGIADAAAQINELVRFVKGIGAEEVFAEAVNPRGSGLKNTEETLRAKGFHAEAETVSSIRQRTHWSPYVADLADGLQRAMQRHMTTEKLRFLLYPSHLTPHDEARIRRQRAGVIWL
jgi:hypothetical protein